MKLKFETKHNLYINMINVMSEVRLAQCVFGPTFGFPQKNFTLQFLLSRFNFSHLNNFDIFYTLLHSVHIPIFLSGEQILCVS